MQRDVLLLGMLMAFANQKKRVVVTTNPVPSPTPSPVAPPIVSPPVVSPPVVLAPTPGPNVISIANAASSLGHLASDYASKGSPSTSVSSPASGEVNASPSSDDNDAQGAEDVHDSGSDLGNLGSSFVSGPDVIQPYTGPLHQSLKPLARATPQEINWGLNTAKYLALWQWAANPAMKVVVRKEAKPDGTLTAVLYR